MAQNDIYSTTAVDGSADEFSPSSTVNTPKTSSQIEAQKAMSLERTDRFTADTSSPFTSLDIDGHTEGDGVVNRRQAGAAAEIAAFDKVFGKGG
ncbi:hypothetical protein BKA64DRAFT_708811 [Cadophora sp. MPI-SDFR-AT-0126]|nr:hypothetical protein BKA64DRAFT_708811 [Leotiomycetes sp. MPI-SDFR-AT-0126]